MVGESLFLGPLGGKSWNRHICVLTLTHRHTTFVYHYVCVCICRLVYIFIYSWLLNKVPINMHTTYGQPSTPADSTNCQPCTTVIITEKYACISGPILFKHTSFKGYIYIYIYTFVYIWVWMCIHMKYIYVYITYKSWVSTDNWFQFTSTEFILAFSFSLFLTYSVTRKLILIYTILDCSGMHKSYFRTVNPMRNKLTGEIQHWIQLFLPPLFQYPVKIP